MRSREGEERRDICIMQPELSVGNASRSLKLERFAGKTGGALKAGEVSIWWLFVKALERLRIECLLLKK